MDNYAGVFTYNFIDEILKTWNDGQVTEINMILCSCEPQRFKNSNHSVIFYDYYNQEPETLGELGFLFHFVT